VKHDDHWLSRPATIRRLWQLFALILAGTVLVQLAIPIEGHFGIDGWFGFAAAFGFLSCVAMVFGAKALGVLLKRRDDYYDD
jgi:hypothetical protein